MSSYYEKDYAKGQQESDKAYEAREWPGMGEYPPPAFYFSVKFPNLSGSTDTSFQEVSGITQEIGTEEVSEGGDNATVYYLPKASKPQKLTLKRGVVPKDSALIQWCTTVLGGTFPSYDGEKNPNVTGSVEVNLMNLNGEAIRSWSFANAYPVKWQADGFNSTKNDVAIETIELCYSSVVREK